MEYKIKSRKVLGIVVKTVLIIILTVYCISLLIPLFWMIVNSFKDAFIFKTKPFGLPDPWMFSNYAEAWNFLSVEIITAYGPRTFGVFHLAFNSVLRSVGIPVITIFFQAVCAYTLACYKFRGSRFLYMLGLVLMILPIVGNLPSGLLVAKTLGTYDNMIANILTAPSMIFGLNFMILYGAYKAVPWTFAEAAFIEGAGHYRVMFLMLRMVLSTCAVLFVMSFLGIWNDYQTPLVWLPSYPNLAYGLYLVRWNSTSGIDGATTPIVLATFVIVMIPTIIIYLAAQRLIERSFVVGGLKG